jgi:hypothetical protein
MTKIINPKIFSFSVFLFLCLILIEINVHAQSLSLVNGNYSQIGSVSNRVSSGLNQPIFASNQLSHHHSILQKEYSPVYYNSDNIDEQWHRAYRKQLGKGIAMMVIGGSFLVTGIASLAVSTQNYLNQQYGLNSSYYLNPNAPVQFFGMAYGSVAIITGIILMPKGSKYLKRAILIKKDGRAREVSFSYAPGFRIINGATEVNTSLSIAF